MKNQGGGRESPHYMTTGLAAKKLRVARETIRLWCLKGRIPGARQLVNRAGWQVPSSWVYEWIERTKPKKLPQVSA